MDELPVIPRLSKVREARVGFAVSTEYSENFLHTENGSDCFIFAGGRGQSGLIAVKETIETAALAYKVLTQKKFYVEAQAHLITQLVKLISRRIFRVRAKVGEVDVSLGIIIFSGRYWWAVVAGNLALYRFNESKFDPIFPVTAIPVSPRLGSTKTVTVEPAGGQLLQNDCFIWTTPSLLLSLTQEVVAQMRAINSPASAQQAADSLLKNTPNGTSAGSAVYLLQTTLL